MHFCDYNREPFFVYGYSKILKFEKMLRELLLDKGLKNEDMKQFLKEKSHKNEIFRGRYEKYDKLPIKSTEPFQCFYLLELLSLLSQKTIIKIDQRINELRNYVMHNKNIILHKNYNEANLIYDFQSFEKVFNLVMLFKEYFKKLENAQNNN